MHVGAAGSLLVRQRETPAGEIAQSGRVSENLNAGLAMPDQDIAALRLDDHSPGGVITGHAQRHLWHACILRHDEVLLHSMCGREGLLPNPGSRCHAADRADGRIVA